MLAKQFSVQGFEFQQECRFQLDRGVEVALRGQRKRDPSRLSVPAFGTLGSF